MSEGSAVRIAVLGPLAIQDGGASTSVAGERQRRAIAALVAAGPAGASADRLAEIVWDDSDRPADPVPHLRTVISRLRKQITDAGISAAAVIESRPGGYRLMPGVAVDAWLFEELFEPTESASPAQRLDRLERALDLWLGEPFENTGAPLALAPVSSRLTELRLSAEEERLEAWLDRGAAQRALGRGLALVDHHPHRERLQKSTALAAYRLGRQREALRLIDEHRMIMREDFGLDPSPDLAALEQAILDHDPILAGPMTEHRMIRGYRLDELVEATGPTERFRATHLALDRSVRVATTRQDEVGLEEVQRFHDWAQVLSRLRHPHLVRFVDVWREPGAAYLVTAPPDRSMSDVLASGPPSFPDGIRWIGDVGSGLRSIHEVGRIHGGVDLRSVFVDSERRAVLDLPELVRPHDTEGVGRDVAALGRLALELLTGRADTGEAALVSAAGYAAAPEALASLLVTTRDGQGPGSVGEFLDRLTRCAGVELREPTEEVRSTNPYPGLVAFDETTAARFHGRDRFVDELMARLAGGDRRLTVVVGPSGSGKSSVVLAGVVPALRERADWAISTVVAVMRPGVDPFAALVGALGNVATRADADLTELLVHEQDPINALVDGALTADLELVLVVDQLEELFTGPAQDHRDRFFEALTTAVRSPSSRVHVVATLRADFLHRVLEVQPFASCLPDAVSVLPALSHEELADVIVLPARAEAVEVDSALVARLIVDAGREPGTLPLLAATLRSLYERRAGDRLTVGVYEDLGGLAAALVEGAEEFVTRLGDSHIGDLRLLFGQLVTMEADHQPVRRSAPIVDLVSVGIPADVIDAGVDARLLVVDRDPASRSPTVTVAHESLLTRWPRLASWLEEDRRFLRERTELTDAAAAWEGDGRDDGRLLRGARLERALEMEASAMPLRTLEQAFIDASVARRDADVAAEQRHERRRRRLLVLSATVAVIALVAGALAVREQRRADREADEARVRLFQQAATGTFDDRPELGIQLALAAVEAGGGTDAERTLVDLLTRPHFDAYLGRVEVNACVSVSPSTAEPALAMVGQVDAGGAAPLSLWDLDDGGLAATVSIPATLTDVCPAIAPAGSWVASVQGTTLFVFETSTGEEISRRDLGFEPDRLTWAVDGTAIAVLDDGTGSVVLLDPSTLEPLRTVEHDAPFPIAIALSSATGRLIVTSDTRPPLAFDLDADTVVELADPDTAVLELEMSADGDVVVGADRRRLFVWHVPSAELTAIDLDGESAARPSVSLSPDSAQVATITSRGVEMYEIASTEPPADPIGLVRGIGTVSFIDAETVVATAAGGRIYRLRATGRSVEVLHEDIEGGIVAPDGRVATYRGTGRDSRSVVVKPDGSFLDVGAGVGTHRPFGDGLTAFYDSKSKDYRVWSDDRLVAKTSLAEVIRPGSIDGRSVRIGHGLAVLNLRDGSGGPPSLNEIVVLDADSGELLAAYPAPNDHLAEPLWPSRLLVASVGDVARITDLNGETVHDLGQFDHPVESAALAADGDLLLGLGDGSVHRLDGASFELRSVHVGPPSNVFSILAFSSGFLVQHVTGEFVLWLDGESEPSGTLYAAQQFAGFGAVSSDERLVYLPDGRRVVALPLEIEAWIDSACRRVGTAVDARSWEAVTGAPPGRLTSCA